MPSITDNVTYVDFTKLQEFNESTPTVNITDFNTVQNEIFNTLSNYSILQWFLSIIIFVGLFMILRKIQFIDINDIQLSALVSFIVIVMNFLLLNLNIFSIIQPLQVFIVLWLILVISIIANKRRRG